jgi:RimJ/RimL family protein N-acetyltransferase
MSTNKIKYKLRKFKKTDANTITKYANNKNIAKWLTKEFPHPYYKKDAESFIDIVSKIDPNIVFTIEINEEAAGSIAVTPQSKENIQKNDYNNINKEKINQNNQTQNTTINICNKQAELGYWLAEKYWNKGIMTLAIEEMVEYGFKTFDIDCIFATPFIENLASQKVLKKVGFASDEKVRKIVKCNESYEVFVFSIKRS